MRLFVAAIASWEILFLTRIVGLNGRKIISSAMPWISHSGNGYYYPAFLPVIYSFDVEAAYRFFLSAIIAFSLELPAYKILKNSIRRDRPYEALPGIQKGVNPGDRFSFPSGHTAAAFLMALLIAHFWPALSVPCFTWAAFVGLSRIYLGVHFPTDVLAGMVLGILSGIAGLAAAA